MNTSHQNPIRALFVLVALVALTGCQAIADHNAHTRADMQAGQAAAAQGNIIAAQVREAIKGIVPAKQEATP